MFAERFSPLIRRHPQDADALSRVADYVRAKEESYGDRVSDLKLDPQRLFDIAQAGSVARLTRLIQILVEEHLLERLIVIESPKGGGFVTYKDLGEVPSEIRDPMSDVLLSVTPDHLKIIYRLARA